MLPDARTPDERELHLFVLILVVMEDAPRQGTTFLNHINRQVLILVVMEDAPRLWSNASTTKAP